MNHLNQQLSQNILCKLLYDITLPSILEPPKSSLQIFEIKFFMVEKEEKYERREEQKEEKERKEERKKGKEGSKRRQVSPA